MSVVLATLVDWNLLGQAVAASFVIGLAVLAITGVAVVSSLRSQDQRSAGGGGAALGWTAVTVVCVLAVAAAIAIGIWVMAQ